MSVIRRSVTFTPEVDRAVRELQARLLLDRNMDVSFAETVNYALAYGISFLQEKPNKKKGIRLRTIVRAVKLFRLKGDDETVAETEALEDEE